jgi:hypothetical protein
MGFFCESDGSAEAHATAATKTIAAFSTKTLEGVDVPLSDYLGKVAYLPTQPVCRLPLQRWMLTNTTPTPQVLLVVNVASL